MSRQQMAFLIALFLILVVALLLPRCRPATPPVSEPVPWPTSTPLATRPPRPTPATPIVIGTRILTPPPTVLAAATPTYVIAQVGDELFQRMLAQQASDVTFRYTTVTRFVGPSLALAPVGAGEMRTEGVYAYGNRYHLVKSGGELVVEMALIGNTLYTRQAAMPDTWRIDELSPLDAMLLRLDVPAAILSADVLVKRLGSERLDGVAVPVTKYEVTVPPERVHQYMLQLAAAASGSSAPAYPAGTGADQMLALAGPAFVWVGDDGHQYRLDFVLTVQTANTDVKPAISTSTTFRDFNDPSVRIAVPEGPFVTQ
jgi:hypothetical protein